jgi:hypothetical protein
MPGVERATAPYRTALGRVRRWRPRPSSWFYAAVALLTSAPAWIVKHPPVQDLPFHLATIRIIRSFHDPAYGFDQHFVLTFGRTQYVIYYLLGAALALFVGVVAANVVLVSAYLGGTVLALRSLLRALGRDERLCLLSVPLLVNVMFVYGLLPFVLGIPILLWGLGTAVRHFERPTLLMGGALCLLALALFYSHVLPFGLFCIGYAAMFPWTKPSRYARCAAPAVPVALVLVWWTFFTAAGRLARGAATDNAGDLHRPLDSAIGDLPNWFTNVLHDTSDELSLVALAILVVVALGLSLGDSDRAKALARPYALVPASCIVFYFILPEGHGYIWLIAQRFPILFAITAIPLLRMPQGGRGMLVSAAALALGAGTVVNVCRHFIRFELDEVGDIDGAIDSMEPNRRVCALIYDKTSAIVNNQPFMHFGSYYQVRKGGVVMFTYAGYAHWPVDFQPGEYPPPGGPARLRWEWMPESVPMSEVFPYYDYVLTRGFGFRPPPGTYHLKFHDPHWAVWERDRSSPRSPPG